MALALATSLASMGGFAYAADATDNQNSVNDPGKPNSGPGVQGAPDTRTGPSTRAPDGSANEGASSGASGSDATTQPSQDSSGVTGSPGNKNGPAASGDAGKDKMKAPMP
jgi:hypothetical protein